MQDNMALRTGSGVEVNKAQLVLLVIGCSMLVYFLYSALPWKRGYHQHHYDSWKRSTFINIPQTVHDNVRNVKIEQKEAKVKVGDNEISVFYRDAPPVTGSKQKHPIVYLHGAQEDGERWQEIGSMQLTAAMGHRSVALDLPGWGKTKGDVKDRGQFLAEFFKSIGVSEPILLPASMGGSYALPYLMEPRADTCHQRAYGLVAIAVVGTDKYTPSQYHRCHIPAMIVYGEKDTHLGLGSAGDLRNLANNEIFPVEKAGHPPHREKTDYWHHLLYNYLQHIE